MCNYGDTVLASLREGHEWGKREVFERRIHLLSCWLGVAFSDRRLRRAVRGVLMCKHVHESSQDNARDDAIFRRGPLREWAMGGSRGFDVFDLAGAP